MTTNAARSFQDIGPDLWEATDGSGILVSVNGTGTLVTVESAEAVRDFPVPGRLQDALDAALVYARSL